MLYEGYEKQIVSIELRYGSRHRYQPILFYFEINPVLPVNTNTAILSSTGSTSSNGTDLKLEKENGYSGNNDLYVSALVSCIVFLVAFLVFLAVSILVLFGKKQQKSGANTDVKLDGTENINEVTQNISIESSESSELLNNRVSNNINNKETSKRLLLSGENNGYIDI